MTLNIRTLAHLNLMADLEKQEPKEVDLFEKLDSDEEVSRTASLSENVLKLCTHLRSSGFNKQAEGLEGKFAQYRQLYTDGADDLIDMAHPGGDAEVVPNKEDLGDVETIFSQQEKDLEIVRRMPTGKLAFIGLTGFKTASPLFDALDECKRALAQEAPAPTPPTKESLLNNIKEEFNAAKLMWQEAFKKITEKGDLVNGLGQFGRGGEWSAWSTKINTTFDESNSVEDITIDSLEKLKKAINYLYNFIKPGVSWTGGLNPWGGVSKDLWKTVAGNFTSIGKHLDNAIKSRNTYVSIESDDAEKRVLNNGASTSASQPTTPVDADPLMTKIRVAIAKIPYIIKSITRKNISEDKKKSGIAYLNAQQADLSEQLKAYEDASKQSPAIKKQLSIEIEKEVDTLSKENEIFRSKVEAM